MASEGKIISEANTSGDPRASRQSSKKTSFEQQTLPESPRSESKETKRDSSIIKPPSSLEDVFNKIKSVSEKAPSTSLLEQYPGPSSADDSTADRAPRQVIKYMNSYRLDSKNPFKKEPVYKIIRDVINEQLEPQPYDPVVMTKNCTNLAGEIRSRVKALGFERYKLICIVQICEKNKQSIVTQTKFLWDSERDNCAVYTLETMQFLASCAVYGLYFE